MAYRRFFSLLTTALLATASVHAAELGEPRIASFRGQALVADIELSSLDDPAVPLQVRVANADVYRGASMTVPPVLSSLQLSVVKQGGKQFVHVTSSRPVDTDMLLLYLELGQGNNRDVRLATLWLAPDPRPAPAPVPFPVPVAVAAPVNPAPAPTPVVAAAVPLPAVATRPELPVHAVAAVAAPLHVAAVSTALPVSVRAPAPASCKASASDNACVVLDTKNVALQAKLAGLEDKIKLLQAALAPVKGASAATTTAELHAEPGTASIVPPIAAIKPPAKPVAVALKPKKPKAAVPAPSSTPWLWIGVAAVVGLAALGAIAFLLLRRRAGKAPAEPGRPKKPGIMDGVRSRLMPGKAVPVTE